MDFSKDKLASKALKLNGTEFAGRPLKVDRANTPSQRQSPAGRGWGGTPRGGISSIYRTDAMLYCYYLRQGWSYARWRWQEGKQ